SEDLGRGLRRRVECLGFDGANWSRGRRSRLATAHSRSRKTAPVKRPVGNARSTESDLLRTSERDRSCWDLSCRLWDRRRSTIAFTALRGNLAKRQNRLWQ